MSERVAGAGGAAAGGAGDAADAVAGAGGLPAGGASDAADAATDGAHDAAAGEALLERIVTLTGTLRAAGVAVGPAEAIVALQALQVVGLQRRDDAYWALRCALTRAPGDAAAFDAAFEQCFAREARSAAAVPAADAPPATHQEREEPAGGPPAAASPHRRANAPDGAANEASAAPGGRGDARDGSADEAWSAPFARRDGAADEADDDTDDDGARLADGWRAASAHELLRRRDFSDYGPGELRAARAALERAARRLPRRTTRRTAPASSGALDARATVRRALRTGGVPLERRRRAPTTAPRRLVFLIDVSGSMEAYTRAMVVFLQAIVSAGAAVEAFAFGTRLTRLTPHLAVRDPGRALERAAAAVPDWDGGTRIGESLRAFDAGFAAHGATRGAIVTIASDGWERGDSALLGEQMARLRRRSHRLVWVNPLTGDPDYQPLAAGMAAALPHLDIFLPGHDLASLLGLLQALEELARRGPRTPVGTGREAGLPAVAKLGWPN